MKSRNLSLSNSTTSSPRIIGIVPTALYNADLVALSNQYCLSLK
jgi:hypothetical protein